VGSLCTYPIKDTFPGKLKFLASLLFNSLNKSELGILFNLILKNIVDVVSPSSKFQKIGILRNNPESQPCWMGNNSRGNEFGMISAGVYISTSSVVGQSVGVLGEGSLLVRLVECERDILHKGTITVFYLDLIVPHASVIFQGNLEKGKTLVDYGY